MKHPIESMIGTTMDELKTMVESNSIVGDPIEMHNGTMILPITKLAFGFVFVDLPAKSRLDCFDCATSSNWFQNLMPTTRRVPTLIENTTAMASLIEHLRQIRDGLIFRQHFQSAVFLSDKILALKPSTEDIFVLAKCLYRLKEYQRAAHIITCRNLHRNDPSCCLLVIKCYVSGSLHFTAQSCVH